MALTAKPFVFIRHGETFYNRARIIAGRFDVPLTPEGEAQARAAHDVLARFDWSYIAVSTMFRARKTARLAVPKGEFNYFDGLRERNWGALEGQPIREPMPYFEAPQGGESWEVFSGRVLDVLNTILACHERPLIIAHSGVFRVIRTVTQGSPFGSRVGNVEPIMCSPPDAYNDAWRLTPLASLLD
ncbi:histidine phosphatase family protein [Phytohalomonas tamaricis]|uniref:histidine phosphatase family protein n=1 Tax=Phytohalomonas tamaricis TaxID=2081032 RepID=UPI000D0B1385|nr:histidine phosphatase family protein [Phytohalomonas tamaricis]